MSTPRRTRRLSAGALIVGVGLGVLVGPLSSTASAAGTAPAAAAMPAATTLPAADSTFFSLLNTLRGTLGVGSLTIDPALSGIARAWSEQMAASGTMSHNPSLGSQATGWQRLGENVGYGGVVTQIFNALVASPPHMRNMSDPEFTKLGIGTVVDGTGRIWTTHVFMRPKAATSPAARAVTSPPTTRVTAPTTTRAPKAAPTTAAPVTAPPTTAAPVTTAPIPVPVAPAPDPEPIPVEAAAAPTTPVSPALASATTPQPRVPAPLLVAASVAFLLVLGGAGFLLRHSTSSRR